MELKLRTFIDLDSKFKRLPVRTLQAVISLFLPSKILFGIFKGIPLIKNWHGSSMLPKLLGTYESEIQEHFLNILKDQDVDAVVDIGCAGGYYLSLASFLREDILFYGIDCSQKAITAVDKYSKKYKKNFITVNKYAGVEDLVNYSNLHKHPLFIVDIEGAEFNLFRGIENIEVLSNSILVIEVHKFHKDFFDLKQIFQKTHKVESIKFADYGFTKDEMFPSDFLKLILRHELRSPRTEYMVIVPLSKSL